MPGTTEVVWRPFLGLVSFTSCNNLQLPVDTCRGRLENKPHEVHLVAKKPVSEQDPAQVPAAIAVACAVAACLSACPPPAVLCEVQPSDTWTCKEEGPGHCGWESACWEAWGLQKVGHGGD